MSKASLSQVYSSLIPQLAFQISFSSIAATVAEAAQVRPHADVYCASAPRTTFYNARGHLTL